MAIQCGYSNPIDFLEYVLRCQNWGDNAIGEQSSGALIRSGVGVLGSFDSTTLDDVRAINIRYQIDEADASNTKDLIDKICKEFSLQQYTDVDGYECVRYLFASETDSTTNILSLDECLDQPIVYNVSDVSKMCVNPVIKYDYDYATKEYTQEIKITNMQTGVYNSAYTTGFIGADGETYWNRMYNEVWPIVKHIEKMDQEWSENKFIIDYAGAIFRLNNLIEIMKCGEISFDLPFEIGYTYNAGDIVLLDYPHLSWTGDGIKWCVITSISKSKFNNSCTISGFTRDIIVGRSYEAESIMIEQTAGNVRM